jgi:L-ascorbate metabolism protein UlaG (beta-lactamase superfamily)
MRLTKMGHACVRLEKQGRTLVIDPGSLTEEEALAGADTVLITHEHPDHVEGGRLATLAERRPGLEVWTTAGVAEQLEGVRASVHVVGEGEVFETAGFDVRVHGGLHALVNPAWPRVANVGFLVDEELFHPGDAYTVPDGEVATLLLPTHAPWLKAPELVEFVGEIAPRRAYSVHDGFLNDAGLKLVDGLLGALAEERGADLRRLTPGEHVELPDRV